MTDLLIDALYEGFVHSLPSSLQRLANSLPWALKLAPVPTVRWTDVFTHEVTLGAPSMLAEAFPSASPDLVRSATTAHAFAVIEAFGSDRVADKQVESIPELLAVLAHLVRTRDAAMAKLGDDGLSEMHRADVLTRGAVLEERLLLSSGKTASFADYERVSLSKQAVGFPASVALVRALGASSVEVELVKRVLEGVSLGLQFEDDVLDWEDDLRHGGAWARALTPHVRVDASFDADAIRRAVHASDALKLMLERSQRCYRSAFNHARTLGATRLATWAKAREERLAGLISLEERHAGYSVRVSRLSSWASEVFA